MMLDHAEFFNFINFEHNIKVRLELLSTLPYKKNLTKVFLADTRIPMLNYIENLFTLDLFCQLIDFESIIKKALVFRDFNSEIFINNFENILHLYPYLKEDLKKKYKINECIDMFTQYVLEKEIRGCKKLTFIKKTYLLLCSSQLINNKYSINNFILNNFETTGIFFNDIDLIEYLNITFCAIKINKFRKNSVLVEYFIQIHEKIMSNTEFFISCGKFNHSLIYKEWGFKYIECYIFLILCWIKLSEASQDLRFLNTALKLVGYFSKISNFNNNIKFNLLLLEALIACQNQLQYLRNRPRALSSLIDEKSKILLLDPMKLMKRTDQKETKILMAVGKNSSTFPFFGNA